MNLVLMTKSVELNSNTTFNHQVRKKNQSSDIPQSRSEHESQPELFHSKGTSGFLFYFLTRASPSEHEFQLESKLRFFFKNMLDMCCIKKAEEVCTATWGETPHQGRPVTELSV
jgi:hypothetical protein